MSRSTLRVTAIVVGGLLASLVLPLSPAGSAEPEPSSSSTATPTATMDSGPIATTLSLTVSTTKVLYGVQLGLIGALNRADGAPVSGARLDLFSRTQGQSGRVLVASVTTDGNGRAQAKLVPRTSAEYQMRFAGDSTTLRADSNLAASNVQPRLSGAFSPAGIALKQTSVLRGSIAPAYAGAKVSIRRRAGDGTYRDIAIIPTSSAGAYSWSVTPGLVGSYVFRVVLPAVPAYLTAYTAPLALQVDARNLRQGDSGGDVASLERRLAAQKADVGRIDGVFDRELTHAVITFQKSQGLARTGVYDRPTSARLAAPVAVRLRFPSSGRAVEIDLRKQVLYLSEGGVLRRMVDISSGNNQPYESEGVTYKAFTPLGRFRVERKIDGVRISRLGELYRPAYFYRGWAIHGSPSVPTYPASHGCIRVINPVQDRLFGLLTVGTPVTVYSG